jgi:hypothetical protein
MTNRGLHIRLPLVKISHTVRYALLACQIRGDIERRIGIRLLLNGTKEAFVRSDKELMYIRPSSKARITDIYILKQAVPQDRPGPVIINSYSKKPTSSRFRLCHSWSFQSQKTIHRASQNDTPSKRTNRILLQYYTSEIWCIGQIDSTNDSRRRLFRDSVLTT